MVAMNDKEFSLLVDWVRRASGIALGDAKRYLIESRLEAVRQEAGCASWLSLHERLAAGERQLVKKAIDAITTNETFFFRDKKTFDLLKHKLIPDLLGEQLHKPLAIWSAACSTGQEAYTLAMVLEEILFDLSKCRIRIFGTDLSEAAVVAANKGEFNRIETARGLDERPPAKYFVRSGDKFKNPRRAALALPLRGRQPVHRPAGGAVRHRLLPQRAHLFLARGSAPGGGEPHPGDAARERSAPRRNRESQRRLGALPAHGIPRGHLLFTSLSD